MRYLATDARQRAVSTGIFQIAPRQNISPAKAQRRKGNRQKRRQPFAFGRNCLLLRLGYRICDEQFLPPEEG